MISFETLATVNLMTITFAAAGVASDLHLDERTYLPISATMALIGVSVTFAWWLSHVKTNFEDRLDRIENLVLSLPCVGTCRKTCKPKRK